MRLVADDLWGIMTVAAEAGGEPMAGKVGVAETIRNRLRVHHLGAKTVADVVLAPLQFSCWNSHDPNRLRAAVLDDTDQVTRECIEAWNMAKAGSETVRGALFYVNPALASPKWIAAMREVARIHHHVFYLPKEDSHG